MKNRDKNGAVKQVIRHTTPDGRVIYDVLSLIQSPEAREHFKLLDSMAEKGLVPRPDPAKP